MLTHLIYKYLDYVLYIYILIISYILIYICVKIKSTYILANKILIYVHWIFSMGGKNISRVLGFCIAIFCFRRFECRCQETFFWLIKKQRSTLKCTEFPYFFFSNIGNIFIDSQNCFKIKKNKESENKWRFPGYIFLLISQLSWLQRKIFTAAPTVIWLANPLSTLQQNEVLR